MRPIFETRAGPRRRKACRLYGLEVGRSVRRIAGGAGALLCQLVHSLLSLCRSWIFILRRFEKLFIDDILDHLACVSLLIAPLRSLLTYAYYAPPLIGGGIKRCLNLSDVCLSLCLSVCLTSVAYIGPKSRTERPRKTKIDTEVAHVTRDSNTTFRVKRSRSPGSFGWLFKSLHNVYRRDQFLRHRPERVAACRSWIFMAQGALDDAGVRRIGCGLEVGRSVRTAGGAGAYCVATHTACYLQRHVEDWSVSLHVFSTLLFSD